MIRTKRVYEARETSDGLRMLIMRFWPRGIRRAQVDEWNRDLAPSRELLFAFKREGLSWKEYARRFKAGIRPEAVEALRRRARRDRITLLCGCAEESRCHRGILRKMMSERRPSGR